LLQSNICIWSRQLPWQCGGPKGYLFASLLVVLGSASGLWTHNCCIMVKFECSDSLFAFNSLHLESRCIFLYSKISVTRVCILHLGVSCSDKLAPAFTIQGMCAWTYSMSGGNLCCLGWCRTRREDARVLSFPHYFGNPYVYCWTGDHYETATCNGE